MDLAKIKQIPNESIEKYITRFKKVRNQCNFLIPESEIIKFAQDGLDFKFKKHFNGIEFRDLFDMTSKSIGYEDILMEGEQRKNKSMGTYYQNFEDNMEVHVAQVIGKHHWCVIL